MPRHQETAAETQEATEERPDRRAVGCPWPPWRQTLALVGVCVNRIGTDNSFSTEDDVQGWTPEDWLMRPYATGFASTARCTTLVNNHFYNLRDAVGIGGDKSLVQGNVIED